MSSSVLHRRKKSYRFGTTWGWENEDSTFNFGLILTFQSVFLLSLCHENMGRGFRGNNEIVFKCFRTSRLYSDRLEDRSVCGYGWHLPWILTIALNHTRTQVHSLSCQNTAADSRITPGLHLFSCLFESAVPGSNPLWKPCGEWRLVFLCWPLSGELCLLQGHPGLGLLDTSTLATGQCRLTRLTLRARSLHAVFGSTSGCVSHTM